MSPFLHRDPFGFLQVVSPLYLCSEADYPFLRAEEMPKKGRVENSADSEGYISRIKISPVAGDADTRATVAQSSKVILFLRDAV